MKTVFKADNVPVEWEQIDVTGVESGDKHSEELFRESIASLRRNKLGLKGMRYSREHIGSRLKRDKVYCTLPWSDLVTSRSTSPCGKNLTFTRQSFSSKTSPVTRPGTITWISA